MKRIFRTGRYANVTATLALIVALGGTSYAAIKLPANSVTTKTVKDRSLLSKDFKRGQIPAGKRGAAGAPGPAGAQGPQGFPGPAGVTASAYAATDAGPTIQANTAQTLGTLTLPGGGNWVVTAKFIATNTTNPAPVTDATLDCTLTIGGVAKDNLSSGGTDFGVGGSAHTLTGAGVGTSAEVACTTTATSGSYGAISLTALRVSSIS
jgi:hypothetical protein